MQTGKIGIAKIWFNLRSRDDIPRVAAYLPERGAARAGVHTAGKRDGAWGRQAQRPPGYGPVAHSGLCCARIMASMVSNATLRPAIVTRNIHRLGDIL